MTRLVLALVACLTLAGLSGAASAGALVEVEDHYVCVITNSEKHEGYCVKTHGVPDLPDRP